MSPGPGITAPRDGECTRCGSDGCAACDARHQGEVRVVDPDTGGEKGQKAIQLGAFDPLALIELGRVTAQGAEKYAAFNYLKGYDWRLSYDALQRHVMLFWAGQAVDEESGALHTAHAMWHAGALTSFQLRGIGRDTRPPEATDFLLADMLRAGAW